MTHVKGAIPRCLASTSGSSVVCYRSTGPKVSSRGGGFCCVQNIATDDEGEDLASAVTATAAVRSQASRTKMARFHELKRQASASTSSQTSSPELRKREASPPLCTVTLRGRTVVKKSSPDSKDDLQGYLKDDLYDNLEATSKTTLRSTGPKVSSRGGGFCCVQNIATDDEGEDLASAVTATAAVRSQASRTKMARFHELKRQASASTSSQTSSPELRKREASPPLCTVTLRGRTVVKKSSPDSKDAILEVVLDNVEDDVKVIIWKDLYDHL
ncbi:hypothetical protein ISCGN_017099 [Ixodes scapularis]